MVSCEMELCRQIDSQQSIKHLHCYLWLNLRDRSVFNFRQIFVRMFFDTPCHEHKEFLFFPSKKHNFGTWKTWLSGRSQVLYNKSRESYSTILTGHTFCTNWSIVPTPWNNIASTLTWPIMHSHELFTKSYKFSAEKRSR